VLSLQFDCVAMELGRALVSHRLGAMRRGALGVGRLLCLAVRGPLL
jgi:hypothetical protein